MSSNQSNSPRPLGEGLGEGADANCIAIRVSKLSKCYQIYEAPRDRLKQFVMPRVQRLAMQVPKKYFREFWALRDVSFEIRKGETVGIIGRNGCGKSTLLQIICGTLSPTIGTVETHGRVAALLELGAGFNPEFTGRENVYMNASILGFSKEEIDARFDDIVAFADIGEFIDQPVKIYSSGMYVRLAFAVIAHVNADVLLIDEALAVGDVFFTQKCMRFLRQFKETGTFVFVSHNTGMVVNMCDRAFWLDQGRMRQIGSAKDVCEAYLASRYNVSTTTRQLQFSGDLDGVSQEPTFSDARSDLINSSNLRNDISVFRFPEKVAGFGSNGAVIRDICLMDDSGATLRSVVGGEFVNLAITIDLLAPVDQVIVGFFVKDRLGQVLFGDNSYLSYRDRPVAAADGDQIKATFSFLMPILPRGSYAMDVAVANGSQAEHNQLEWLHDVLVLESHSSSVSTGLVGIPYRQIKVEKKRP